DRFGGNQDRLGVLSIGVSDAQLMARALLDDVGDPRAEHAALAGHLLVDEIGDLVGGEPGLRGGEGERDAADLGLLEHIEQAKAHLELPVGKPLRLPDDHGVREAALPFGEIDLGDLGGRRIDPADEYRTEAAASREILLDDVRDALRQHRLPCERKPCAGNLVAAAPDELDGELGPGWPGEEQDRRKERGKRPRAHSLGLKLILNSRSHCSGRSGLGSGELFQIARSTAESRSALPLVLTSRAENTSPVGSCTMLKTTSGFPLISDGGMMCVLILVRILSM